MGCLPRLSRLHFRANGREHAMSAQRRQFYPSTYKIYRKLIIPQKMSANIESRHTLRVGWMVLLAMYTILQLADPDFEPVFVMVKQHLVCVVSRYSPRKAR